MEKQQIEKELKELKAKVEQLTAALNEPDKFEVGKWYKSNEGHLWCITNNSNPFILQAFGFTSDGQWDNDSKRDGIYTRRETYRPATPSEVKDALVKEAEKRGFKEGVIVKGGFFGNGDLDLKVRPSHLAYDQGCERLYFSGGHPDGCALVIYQAGQWATIVKDEPIMIGGKIGTVDVNKKYFTINDNHYSKQALTTIKNIFEIHTDIKSLNVGCIG